MAATTSRSPAPPAPARSPIRSSEPWRTTAPTMTPALPPGGPLIDAVPAAPAARAPTSAESRARRGRPGRRGLRGGGAHPGRASGHRPPGLPLGVDQAGQVRREPPRRPGDAGRSPRRTGNDLPLPALRGRAHAVPIARAARPPGQGPLREAEAIDPPPAEVHQLHGRPPLRRHRRGRRQRQEVLRPRRAPGTEAGASGRR